MTNLSSVLEQAAADHGERPAVRLDGLVLTYAGLRDAAGRMTALLQALGIVPGDRVELWMMAKGGGGHPGMATSTGMMSDAPPPEMKLGPKTPPQSAHAPTATTLFGVGIASYTFWRGIRMWSVTGPATSRTSASRGVGVRKNPRRCIL